MAALQVAISSDLMTSTSLSCLLLFWPSPLTSVSALSSFLFIWLLASSFLFGEACQQTCHSLHFHFWLPLPSLPSCSFYPLSFVLTFSGGWVVSVWWVCLVPVWCGSMVCQQVLRLLLLHLLFPGCHLGFVVPSWPPRLAFYCAIAPLVLLLLQSRCQQC